MLSELFDAQRREPGGVGYTRFRAQHAEHLDDLDRMAQTGWIERQDKVYFVPLVAVAELATTNAQADSIVYLCRHIFDCLRKLYVADPEKQYLIRDLAEIVDMPLGQVRRALPFLRQGSLFSGYTTDLQAPEAYVLIAEEVIRRKTFDEIIDQHYKWLNSKNDSTLQPIQQNSKNRSRHKKLRSFSTPLETYTIGKQIGQGGSGIVFGAKDENGKPVAIKYIDPKRITGSRNTRFRNEIRFGQQIRHPNIVPVLDVGEIIIDGQATLFFVMPLYSTTLRDALTGDFSAEMALRIFTQILNGVEAAHSVRVWHRDLKPENILLSEDLEDVCVADFGIAHFESEDLYSAAETKSAERLANFRYAAPEQRDRDTTADHKSDLFALGLMLNEMLTGEVPQGTAYREIAQRHPTHAHLDEVVAEMIRQNPDDRPSSIDSVRHRLNPSTSKHIASETFTSSTAFFSNRFSKAFPGVRGIQVIDNFANSAGRLEILLQQPLQMEGRAPICWWRSGDMSIKHMRILSDDTILLDEQELVVQRVAAVNAGSYYQKFVYVEVREGTPSGLYDYSYIPDSVEETGFAREEFAIYDGHTISRAEYDDGAAIIGGMPTQFESAPELRLRYLTPYNFLIAPVGSPINNNNFDGTRDQLMNQLLRGDSQLEDLVDSVMALPKLVRPN